MKHVNCSGTPFEIGQQHGQQAAAQVKGSVAFYEAFFKKRTKKSWSEVQEVATKFLPYLQSTCPSYLEEMRGIADGAGLEFESILALNVRTEIAYGLQSDGCTTFSWKTKTASFLAQNWDWDAEQIPNIICLHIVKEGKPNMHMMTEGGIIGKIGLNSAGVGVTLNAIYAKGVDFGKMPCHLALRTVLESTSMQAARETLLRTGVAAACYITAADANEGAMGMECTSADIVELPMEGGMTTHSNHLIKPHKINDTLGLPDSISRLDRIRELLSSSGDTPKMENLRNLLKDEKNFPTAICRQQTEKSTIATLFSIVMDLQKKYAVVKMGRPTEAGEEIELKP